MVKCFSTALTVLCTRLNKSGWAGSYYAINNLYWIIEKGEKKIFTAEGAEKNLINLLIIFYFAALHAVKVNMTL